MDWNSLKDEAGRMLLEKDALHIYAALLIQVGAAKLSRCSLGHLLPWFVVLGFELLNEANDIRRGGEPHLMAWQVVSGVHDIINTMALPTVLFLMCRRAPGMFVWRADRHMPKVPISGRSSYFSETADGDDVHSGRNGSAARSAALAAPGPDSSARSRSPSSLGRHEEQARRL